MEKFVISYQRCDFSHPVDNINRFAIKKIDMHSWIDRPDFKREPTLAAFPSSWRKNFCQVIEPSLNLFCQIFHFFFFWINQFGW